MDNLHEKQEDTSTSETRHVDNDSNMETSNRTAERADIAGSSSLSGMAGLPKHIPLQEAERIAQLLAVSPDVINISVNVGFNTKVAVEEILNLRAENSNLREENRRLRARLGGEPTADTVREGNQGLQSMTMKELANLIQVTEARADAYVQVRELELENARTRLQMTFMPERVHTAGHGGKPWA